MPDAKGVEGSPLPRPSLLRAAAATSARSANPAKPPPAPGSGTVAGAARRADGHPGPGRARAATGRPRRARRIVPSARLAQRHRRSPRRPLPDADAAALQAGGERRHPRTHRHEPGATDRRRRPPADRARRGRSRVRHARSAARRLRLPPQPGAQLPRQPRRHLRLARRRSAA